MRSIFMRCPQCGTVNPNANNFCGHCGVPLVDVQGFGATEHGTVAEPVTTTNVVPASSVANAHSRSQSTDVKSVIAPPPPRIEPAQAAALLDDDYVAQPLPPAPVSRAVESHERSTISGPSFLGLTDSEESDQSSYLLEDERSGHGGAFLFTLIVIAILAGIGWLVWSNVKAGKITLPFLSAAASQPESKPTATAPKDANAANPQADSSNSDDKLIVNDSGTDEDHSSSATPTKPVNEAAATEASQSRQAKEADQHRASDTSDTAAKSEAKPSAQSQSKPNPSHAAAPESLADPRAAKMLALGEKYLYGHGVARSCQQAMVYFRAAADANSAPAMSHLGAMYNTGECVRQDRAQAYSWLRRAHDADPSNQWIQRDMNMMWRDMSPPERASISH